MILHQGLNGNALEGFRVIKEGKPHDAQDTCHPGASLGDQFRRSLKGSSGGDEVVDENDPQALSDVVDMHRPSNRQSGPCEFSATGAAKIKPRASIAAIASAFMAAAFVVSPSMLSRKAAGSINMSMPARIA